MPRLPDSVRRANPVSVCVSVITAPVTRFFSVSEIVPVSEAVAVCAERNALSDNSEHKRKTESQGSGKIPKGTCSRTVAGAFLSSDYYPRFPGLLLLDGRVEIAAANKRRAREVGDDYKPQPSRQ